MTTIYCISGGGSLGAMNTSQHSPTSFRKHWESPRGPDSAMADTVVSEDAGFLGIWSHPLDTGGSTIPIVGSWKTVPGFALLSMSCGRPMRQTRTIL